MRIANIDIGNKKRRLKMTTELIRRLGWDFSPSVDIDQMERAMDRLFGIRQDYPAVNVWANKDQITVTAELPGMDAADIHVTVEGNRLTLAGERKPETLHKDGRYLRQERGTGAFEHSLQLPYEADSAKVTAKYDRGLLWVSLPRKEESKPKNITISAA
jgi:HSP20 family protein